MKWEDEGGAWSGLTVIHMQLESDFYFYYFPSFVFGSNLATIRSKVFFQFIFAGESLFFFFLGPDTE